MTIGERIKKLRKSLKLTQKEFAERAKISSASQICDFEKGLRSPSSKTIIRIAKAFNINTSWLLIGVTEKKLIPTFILENTQEQSAERLTPIPVINEVPAGFPTYPDIDDYVRTYIYLPDVPKKSFGLFVNGESMEPEIYDGDIIILNPTIEHIKKGDLGVFRINGDVSLKRYLPAEKGIFLQPANPDFAPIFVSSDDECELIGKVIYKILKCNRRI